MKRNSTILLSMLALGASALVALAQDEGKPPGGPEGAGGPGGRGGQRSSPLMDALDANHDGVIDASEIANASQALKALDKNGDGQITKEEARPPGGGKGGKGHKKDKDANPAAPAAN